MRPHHTHRVLGSVAEQRNRTPGRGVPFLWAGLYGSLVCVHVRSHGCPGVRARGFHPDLRAHPGVASVGLRYITCHACSRRATACSPLPPDPNARTPAVLSPQRTPIYLGTSSVVAARRIRYTTIEPSPGVVGQRGLDRTPLSASAKHPRRPPRRGDKGHRGMLVTVRFSHDEVRGAGG